MKVYLRYAALAGPLLLLAGAIAVLAQDSPEASYTPITSVGFIPVFLGVLIARALLLVAVKE